MSDSAIEDAPPLVSQIRVHSCGLVEVYYFDGNSIRWLMTGVAEETADLLAESPELRAYAESIWPYVQRCLETGALDVDLPALTIQIDLDAC